jgi:hypothetical protein
VSGGANVITPSANKHMYIFLYRSVNGQKRGGRERPPE